MTLDVAPQAIGELPEIQRALAGRETSGFWPQANGVVQVVTVPIAIGLDSPELMGTLTVGFRLDNALAEQFKRVTESDIAFAVDGQIKASTLPAGDRGQSDVAAEERQRADDRARRRRVRRAEAPAVAGRRFGRQAKRRRPCCCCDRAPSGCGS